MKFESIKENSLFGSFEKGKINNLNAILGGYKSVTDNNVASKGGTDCLDSSTGTVTDDGNCLVSGGSGSNSSSAF